MKKDDHYLTGSLLKTTGMKGEIILKFNNDLPDEILKLESILVEVDGKLVPFFIENSKIKSNQTLIVQIEGLDSDQKSQEFIGADFYISKKQKEATGVDVSEFIDVLGYQVKDQNDVLIGTVIEFVDIAKNPLLNVKTSQGEKLIPAGEDLILDLDDQLQIIYLEIPDGLLDLS
jgi:16S rRNA processing protein RimM